MKSHLFLKIFVMIIIFAFVCSYIIGNTGYYEYRLSHQKTFTENQIKLFEEDVKNGNAIDANYYLNRGESHVYSNRLTDAVSAVNLKLNRYLKKMLTHFFDILKKFIS